MTAWELKRDLRAFLDPDHRAQVWDDNAVVDAAMATRVALVQAQGQVQLAQQVIRSQDETRRARVPVFVGGLIAGLVGGLCLAAVIGAVL